MNLMVTISSFLISWILVGIVRAIALRAGLMDIPNHRSSHVRPTPRGGGIAIVTIVLTSLAMVIALHEESPRFPMMWAAGGALVSAAGFLDDVREVSAWIRLGIQSIAASVIIWAAGGFPSLPTPTGAIDLGGIGWIVGAAAIVWSINIYNFMDGIDGLAASQTVFVAVAGAFLLAMSGSVDSLQIPLFALAGASAGFLIWNFPPAKIFMGDVGSGFVGFSLAAVAIFAAAHGAVSLWAWFVLNALFVVDATTTLVTRLIRRERVYQAHRSHVYQRLARRWYSHRTVTLAYSTINVVWCLPWAVAAYRWPESGPIFAALAATPLFWFAIAGGAGRPDR
jgi:Fuc2NAc and GlcNAc transferase